MKIHAIRFTPGQDIRRALSDFAIANEITAGWVMAGIGSLTQAHIRFANATSGTKRTGYFEIISLSGTLSRFGCHLHIAIADQSGSVSGGHLLDGSIIYTTAEIVIGTDESLVFTREQDGTTPWPELKITPKS